MSEYSGNLKAFLDSTCEHLNRDWRSREGEIREHASKCERAILATREVFGQDHAFSRWRNGAFEGRFNRAVYDIMVFYFSDVTTAALAVSRHDAVVQGFKRLCDHDAEFANALQVTTKSIAATHTRLARWGESLSAAIGTQMEIPRLEGSRIAYSI
ncbi:MAG: hypothetical protein R3B68_11605 [Phycisphaerales bacterium]